MKKVGILTSGGDCQGLNPAIRGVAKGLYDIYGKEVKIYGIKDGYKGLIDGEYEIMKKSAFSGILTMGGTIFGTSRQPFKQMRVIGDDGVDKVKAMKENYEKMGLDCLVILGGNGTHKTANLLSEEGLNVVTLPKTIDNDLWETDITFGFYSALDVATEVIDRLHTTATSHGRIFVVEIMGHKAGWLNLYAGLAGGADIILIPEIPYSIDKITEVIDSRTKEGKVFSIVAVAEGAISLEESKMSKKEFKAARAAMTHSSIAYRVADDIAKVTGHDVRVTVPGHIQRGGSPSAYDRVLSTMFGTKAAELIRDGKFGYMVGMKNNEVVPVPLSEVAGKLKCVPLDNQVVASARNIGISFGD
ncbi:MAG: 6-phosphofructokinase [Clostridiales bacterium]|nr:6-phosphofructokinase [Clostridiales bacterium]